MLASAVLGLCARVVVAPTAMSDFRPTACYALYCVRPSRLRPSRGRCYSVTTLHSPSSEAHAAAETYAVFVLSCADLGAAYGTAKAGVGIASMGEYKVFLLSSIPALSRSSANVALEMKQDFPIAAAHPLMVVNLDFWLVRRTGGRYLELLATCVHTNVSDGVAIRCNLPASRQFSRCRSYLGSCFHAFLHGQDAEINWCLGTCNCRRLFNRKLELGRSAIAVWPQRTLADR